MTPKKWIVAGVLTAGLVPLVWWAYRTVKHIDKGGVTPEWVSTAEYNREGFRD